MSGWNRIGCQARDLTVGRAARVVDPDVVDYSWGKSWWSARSARGGSWAGGFEVLVHEALEFVDGDQALTPGRLDRVDRRYDSPVDRRDADAESLCSLPAAVREALDGEDFTELVRTARRWRRRGRMPWGSFTPALPSCAHGRRTLILAADSTYGASVSLLLSGYRLLYPLGWLVRHYGRPS